MFLSPSPRFLYGLCKIVYANSALQMRTCELLFYCIMDFGEWKRGVGRCQNTLLFLAIFVIAYVPDQYSCHKSSNSRNMYRDNGNEQKNRVFQFVFPENPSKQFEKFFRVVPYHSHELFHRMFRFGQYFLCVQFHKSLRIFSCCACQFFYRTFHFNKFTSSKQVHKHLLLMLELNSRNADR